MAGYNIGKVEYNVKKNVVHINMKCTIQKKKSSHEDKNKKHVYRQHPVKALDCIIAEYFIRFNLTFYNGSDRRYRFNK